MQRTRKDGNPLNLPARCHFKHNAYWYIHAHSGRWENLGSDINKARIKSTHYNHDLLTELTMSWFIDEYILHFEQLVVLKQKAPRTLSDYQQYARMLTTHFGHLKPDMISSADISHYLLLQQQQGRGVRANREKALLASIFNWLIKSGQGNVQTNPCARISRNQETPRVRIITDHEYQTIYQLATPHVQLAMELSYCTLQAPFSVLTLRRNALCLNNNELLLQLTQTKTSAKLSIALNEQVQQLIQQVTAKPISALPEDDGYLLVSRLGKPYSCSGIAAMLHRYQKSSKIAPFGLQDVKVKGANDLMQSGVPIEVISERLGHKHLTITRQFFNLHTALGKLGSAPG